MAAPSATPGQVVIPDVGLLQRPYSGVAPGRDPLSAGRPQRHSGPVLFVLRCTGHAGHRFVDWFVDYVTRLKGILNNRRTLPAARARHRPNGGLTPRYPSRETPARAVQFKQRNRAMPPTFYPHPTWPFPPDTGIVRAESPLTPVTYHTRVLFSSLARHSLPQKNGAKKVRFRPWTYIALLICVLNRT